MICCSRSASSTRYASTFHSSFSRAPRKSEGEEGKGEASDPGKKKGGSVLRAM